MSGQSGGNERSSVKQFLESIKDSNPVSSYLYDDLYSGYRTSWFLTPRQITHRILSDPTILKHYLSNLYNRSFQKRHVSIMDEDWDNLIILDACTYELFEQTVTMEGDLRKVVSAGSGTGEFLYRSLSERDLSDTVYVTATPGIEHVREHTTIDLFDVVSVWKDRWDDELETVHPSAMVEETKAVYEQHPDKRIIAHFIQPHYPFIGETGQEISHRTLLAKQSDTDEETESVWTKLRNGTVEAADVRQAYEENLEIVLPFVEELVEDIDGKTVVTSDHGNSFGSGNTYGHASGVYIPELVHVPWFVPEWDRRREITTGEPTAESGEVDEQVHDRLADLGYVDGKDSF